MARTKWNIEAVYRAAQAGPKHFKVYRKDTGEVHGRFGSMADAIDAQERLLQSGDPWRVSFDPQGRAA